MWMVRFQLVLVVIAAIFFVMDPYYLRHQTAEKEVVSARMASTKVSSLDVVTTDVLNEEARMKFATDALVLIFNYKTGEAKAHIEKEEIKALFANEAVYEKFKESFLKWSVRELSVNKIAIKESLNTGLMMTRAIPINVTDRVWILKGKQLFLNRGLGKSLPESMKLDMLLSYQGKQGGLGIYHLELVGRPI